MVITLVHFLSIAALCAFLGVYAGPEIGTFCLALCYALLPHWWHYFPVASYPLEFHSAILLFFSAALLRILSIRMNRFGVAPRLLTGISISCLLFSLCVYEPLTLAFTVLSAVFLIREAQLGADPANRRNVRLRFLKLSFPFASIFAAYFVAYAWFRAAHPTSYEGMQISGHSAFNVPGIANAVFWYAAGGFPGANYFLQRGFVETYSSGSVQALGWAGFFVRNTTFNGLVEVMLLALVVWTYFRGSAVCGRISLSPAGADQTEPRVIRGLIRTAALAVLLALFTQVPSSLVVRYQDHAKSATPYVSSYFAYLAFIVALAALLSILRSVARRWNNLVRNGVGTALVILLSLLTVVTTVASDAVVKSQQTHFATWRLLQLFLKSSVFERLPDNAVIVAPTLWDISSPIENYWQEYVRVHGRRPIQVVAKRVAAPPNTPRYYLEIQQLAGNKASFLLFSDLQDRPSMPATAAISTSVWLFSDEDFKNTVLSLTPVSTDAPDRSRDPVANSVLAAVPVPRFERGAFFTTVPVSAFLTGTAYLKSVKETMPNKLAGLAAPVVEVLFGQGFSSVERSGPDFWCWNDGDTGQATMTLVNHTGLGLRVRFSAQIMTSTPGRQTLDLRGAGVQETLRVFDGDRLERILKLAPGENDIVFKSDGPPLRGPDPRRLVYALRDWSMAVVP